VAESTPSPIRSTVTDDEFGGFRITIPAASHVARREFGYGLICWAAGTALLMVLTVFYLLSDMAPHGNASGGTGFLFFLWVLPGMLLGGGLVHATTSREVVTIDGKFLALRKELAGLHFSRTFGMAGIRNLRPARVVGQRNRYAHYPSAVSFDHGGATHYFGVGLSEAEVLRLIKTLRQRFRIPDDLDDAEPLPVIQ